MTILSATVCMPWRPTPDRVPAYQRCTRYWADHGYPVVCGDSNPLRRFNRAAARNNAVDQASTDVLIVADADVLPANHDQIRRAIVLAAQGVAAAPYEQYLLLPAGAVTAPDLSAVDVVREFPRKYRPCGVTVISKTSWNTVGGYDEQFGAGWGYEDAAFWLACDTLIGTRSLPGAVYAFNHQGKRTRHPRNKRRFWWYEQAAGNREEMRRLTNAASSRLPGQTG